MQKAAEDMKKKQAEEAASKKKIIDERVPKLEVAGLSQGRAVHVHLECMTLWPQC